MQMVFFLLDLLKTETNNSFYVQIWLVMCCFHQKCSTCKFNFYSQMLKNNFRFKSESCLQRWHIHISQLVPETTKMQNYIEKSVIRISGSREKISVTFLHQFFQGRVQDSFHRHSPFTSLFSPHSLPLCHQILSLLLF